MDTSLRSDRRAFLKRMALLTGGLMAAGGGSYCALRRKGPVGPLPFTVWRDIRKALRSSPDHLVARADGLVAAGDMEGLFRLVRDSIATYPSAPAAVHATRGYRWGTRATLRGGAGTPREKADLLAELFKRAGAEAEVLVGTIAMSPAEVQKVLWKPADRAFAPDIDEAKMEGWCRSLGIPEDTAFALPRFDEDGSAAASLGRSIWEQLPELSPAPRAFDWRWAGGTPVVRVTKDGRTWHANLFKGESAFGELGVDPARLTRAPAPEEIPDVEVTLEAAMSATPSERFELVSGRWNLADLVGRQILVQMLPGLGLREQVVAKFNDVRTFIPALTIQALDLDQAGAAAMSVLGDPVTRDGARMKLTGDGEVLIDGRVVSSPASAPPLEKVASLEVKPNASHAPLIRLEARALDAAGNPVEGLDASAFRLEEDGRPAGFLMRSGRASPRIELLCDQSGSMPALYRTKAMDELVERLKAQIRSVHPHAEVRLRKTDSDLWAWLTKAAGTDANLIVYATDGHLEGELTDSMRAAIKSGPPVLLIDVNNYAEDHHWYRNTYVPMKEIARATIVGVADEADINAAMLAYLRDNLPPPAPYQLEYGAPSDRGGEHHVTLRTSDDRVSARAVYLMPERPAMPPELCGLYLTVKMGNERYTRTLAGFDPALPPRTPANAGMVNETLGACFGDITLSFEAAAPPLSVWLDDVIGAKLSMEALHQAVPGGSLDDIETVAKQGIAHLPGDLALQATPLHDAITTRSLTFENGPRVMLRKSFPVFESNRVVRQIDFLPFTHYATAASDPIEAFKMTLEKTARFAIAERELFSVNTSALLAGEKLVDARTLFQNPEIAQDQRNPWRALLNHYPPRDYKLMPADGSPRAFWNIDFTGGALLGALADGSGGGRAETSIEETLSGFSDVMTGYNLLLIGAGAALTPMGGMALGVVGAYGQYLVRMYAAASLAIAIMDASGINDAARAALQSFVCECTKVIFTGVFGRWGDAFTGLDTLIGAIGGQKSPFSCP